MTSQTRQQESLTKARSETIGSYAICRRRGESSTTRRWRWALISLLKPRDDTKRSSKTTTRTSPKRYRMSEPIQLCLSCSHTFQRFSCTRTKSRRTATSKRFFSRARKSNYCVAIPMKMKVPPSRLSSRSRCSMLRSKSTRNESLSIS